MTLFNIISIIAWNTMDFFNAHEDLTELAAFLWFYDELNLDEFNVE